MDVKKGETLSGNKDWTFSDGIYVREAEFDGNLRIFEVFNGDDYLGDVTPPDVENMELLEKELDNGANPISGDWEDGMGNSCTLDGWGQEEMKQTTYRRPSRP